jgi:hypothetical protein
VLVPSESGAGAALCLKEDRKYKGYNGTHTCLCSQVRTLFQAHICVFHYITLHSVAQVKTVNRIYTQRARGKKWENEEIENKNKVRKLFLCLFKHMP